MPEGTDPTKVEWEPWSQASLDRARQAGKPILLAVMTPWSAECREMESTTYAEPRIAANINDGFVPIRVDADRYPRLRDRYNMGGFPSTVFLTPRGRVLTGATFLGIDGFRQILDRVRETWDAKGEDAGSIPRALSGDQPPSGPIDERVEEHMVEQLLGAYDEEFGGWGSDVKFPMPRTIEFALVRARDQAVRTLEAVQTHLYDTYDGGFYRYARNRNWGGARREKLLDENAALIRTFAYGYRYTGQESYRESAAGTIDYLTTSLWTGEGFAASQGGDEDYFRLEPTEREATEQPSIDSTVLADRNGLAIDALLRYAAYTDDEDVIQYARRARDYVVEELVSEGAVTHFETDSQTGESGLLIDQARVLDGLTTAWEVLGEPGPALAVADWTIEHLQTETGAMMDGRPTGPGLLDTPLYPLDTTIEVADALLDLALLSGDETYRVASREAMEAFGGAADRMGVEVAHYATVAARHQAPQVIEVGAPARSELHRAALRLADHETVVVPASEHRSPLCESQPVESGVAQIVEDGSVTATATSPGELETVLTNTE